MDLPFTTDLHPRAEALGGDDQRHRCPCCGEAAPLDAFDVWGADEDCVFCPGCGTELQT